MTGYYVRKIRKKFFIFLAVFAVLSFFLFGYFEVMAQGYNYEPMEKIPGFESDEEKYDFPSFILNLYKFGIWTIGIAALLMIIIGGFNYIASVNIGNTSKTDTAKKMIIDAVSGLILAMFAYLLLFVINPDLVKINLSMFEIGEKTGAELRGVTAPSSVVTVTMPADCESDEWQKIFNDASGGDKMQKCILQATAAKESSCQENVGRTGPGAGDCSVMQIRAEEHCGTTCENLEKNPAEAVKCAKGYINNKIIGSGKVRGTEGSEQWVEDVYAGYNGGPGVLSASDDCDDSHENEYGNTVVKYDCPINQGGYVFLDRVLTKKFLSLYEQCM